MKIGIIGAGRTGVALGYVLRTKGFKVVAIASRRQSSLDAAKTYIGPDCLYTLDNNLAVQMADIVAVTTQDREIKNVAAQIAAVPGRLDGKLFFHTSGAHAASELSPLDGKGALLGSLHPLQTFPDIAAGIRDLPSAYIFIEGAEKALPALKELASSIGVDVVVIESSHKMLYHVSAVFVCNLLTALLYAGEGVMGRIGIGLDPFYPIIRATLGNIEAKGPLLSLTGPVARGDVGTVSSHLEAIRDMPLHRRIYKSLSLAALEMARKRGTATEEQIAGIRRLLEEE
jgi:predicted short-subunit dehydrogenase-like oxidoreductase (DUF2520 family)